jgi:hypothetical protein
LAEPEPKQKEARELLERITWQKVTDYTEKYPQNYDVIGRLVREYIGRKDVDKTHLSEATKLKKQKEIEWDRTAFEEIRRTAKPAYEHEIAKRSPESLQKARERAESYLQSRNDRLREPDSPGYKRLESFWKELDRWVKWIETVEKQTEYRYWYEIKSVRIPDGAQANGSVWVKIEVNGNGEVGPAKWLTGRNVTVEQTYGPYTGIWGSPGELRVHVLGYRYWPHTNDDFPAVVVKDDNFIPGKGRGVVRVPARDGKEIEIELRCWQKINDKWHSVPPVLPEYPIARETTAK